MSFLPLGAAVVRAGEVGAPVPTAAVVAESDPPAPKVRVRMVIFTSITCTCQKRHQKMATLIFTMVSEMVICLPSSRVRVSFLQDCRSATRVVLSLMALRVVVVSVAESSSRSLSLLSAVLVAVVLKLVHWVSRALQPSPSSSLVVLLLSASRPLEPSVPDPWETTGGESQENRAPYRARRS